MKIKCKKCDDVVSVHAITIYSNVIHMHYKCGVCGDYATEKIVHKPTNNYYSRISIAAHVETVTKHILGDCAVTVDRHDIKDGDGACMGHIMTLAEGI